MQYITVTATKPNGRLVFTGTFYSEDPTEPLGQFARNLSKHAMPSDLFGADTAKKLHAAIDPLSPDLEWDAGVSRGG